MIKTWQQRCEEHPDHNGIVTHRMIQQRMQEEIDDLRAAIEQAQEPVAWMCSDPSLLNKGYLSFSRDCRDTWNIPVYLAPPPRQWQGLTTDEVFECQEASYMDTYSNIEAKLKEKNT